MYFDCYMLTKIILSLLKLFIQGGVVKCIQANRHFVTVTFSCFHWFYVFLKENVFSVGIKDV
jgi:hypothetical protein